MKKPLRLGLEIAVALVLLWAFMLWQQRHLIPTDQIAPPAVELPTLAGDTAPLYQANQRTLVYFRTLVQYLQNQYAQSTSDPA